MASTDINYCDSPPSSYTDSEPSLCDISLCDTPMHTNDMTNIKLYHTAISNLFQSLDTVHPITP